MTPEVEAVLEDLESRARQRGFLMMAEVQQELEDVGAPPEAFATPIPIDPQSLVAVYFPCPGVRGGVYLQ